MCPWRLARLSVRQESPGSGRFVVMRIEQEEISTWFFFDINYVRHFALADIKILAATFLLCLAGVSLSLT